MKKILLFASALAGLFLAGSCQRENLEPEQTGKQVTFTVEAPAAMQTKAIADGKNVDQLIYEVWITGQSQKVTEDLRSSATRLYQATTDMAVAADGKVKATITLDLVNDQNFTVLFWAQKEGINVYNTAWLDAVTYTNTAAEAYSANDNRLDAFYGKAFVSDGQTTTPTVILKRPFAQVNLCTLNSKDAAQTSDNYNISLVSSKMALVKVPTVFNVATSAATEEKPMEFAANTVPSGEDKMITVNGKQYFYAGMNYVFAGSNITLTYDIQTKLNGTVDANVNNTIQDVPLKENYRTNIVGNLLTSKVDYEIIVDADFNEPAHGEIYPVTTDEQLAKALSADAEIIEVHLGADLNLTAANAIKLGGPKTKKIIINGDKALTRAASAQAYTLNVTTSYAVEFKTVNPDAVLVFKNLNLNSSKVSGTWDTYDIQLHGAVEMENVNCLQAIALVGENKTVKLNNVTIDEPNNYYALWIWGKGLNVEWNGGTINSLGRGIKIDDEYIAEPAATTLKITNVDFNTKNKGAIVVNSSAAVAIEAENIDIEDVAADPINAVWVDEDAADYFDRVTVTGCTKVLEGSAQAPYMVVSNAEELQTAVNVAEKGTYLIVFKNDITGNATILQKEGINLVINGREKKFDGTFTILGGNRMGEPETLRFENINFNHTEAGDFYFIDANSTVSGEMNAHNVTVYNCSFTGTETSVAMRYRQCGNMVVSNSTATGIHSLIQAYGNVGLTIDDVTVEAVRGISLGSSYNVLIKDSEFTADTYGIRGNGDGKANDIDITVENSTITAKQPIVIRKVNDAEHTYNVTLTGTTSLNPTEEGDYQVVFTNDADDKAYVKPTGKWNLSDKDNWNVFPTPTLVATWEEFTNALNANETDIKLTADITYDKSFDLKKNVTIDLNGQSLEISNPALMLNIFSTATIKNGTIKGKVYARTGSNITFDGVTFGGSINAEGSTEGLLQVQGACNVYANNCSFDATNSNNTKTRPLSMQSTTSGTYRFEGCDFISNSNQNQVYINNLGGSVTLDLTRCNFKTRSIFGLGNKAANIQLASSFIWSNMNLTGCSGGFTFEISRASTSLTAEEMEIYRTIKSNNSGSMRFIFTDGEKNNL